MKVEASLSRALETLGLTPQSRRKLRLSKKDRKTIADYILESEDEATLPTVYKKEFH